MNKRVLVKFSGEALAGTEGYGTYISTNNGTNWTQTAVNRHSVFSLASSGSIFFAGVDKYPAGYGGVHISTNNGGNWHQTAFNNENISSIAVSGNKIYAGTFNDPYPSIYCIYISTNNGSNWAQCSLTGKNILSLTAFGNNVIAGTQFNGVYLSTDNGNTWTQTGLYNQSVSSFARTGNYVFAGSQDSGVYISTDNGASWTQTALNDKQVYSLAVNGNSIFAGTRFNGIYLSTNNGTAWTQTALNNKDVSSLSVSGNNIFAVADNSSSGYSSVYLSTNNGVNWSEKNQGFKNLRYLHINDLLITDNYIYAGTWKYSVWRRSLSEIIGIQTITTETPSTFSLSQNYPNPFNPNTVVRFSLSVVSDVVLKVYDVTGKEVQTLVNERVQAGSYETTFDARQGGSSRGLNSGVYFYKLTTEDFSETKRMILLK